MKRYRNDDEVFTCLRNNATNIMQLQKIETFRKTTNSLETVKTGNGKRIHKFKLDLGCDS